MENDKFTQLVLGLQSSCWMMLGKMANPMSGQMETNLNEADHIIKTLMMLQEKTKGNLTETEQKTLDSVIQQLQVNYVEESKKSGGN